MTKTKKPMQTVILDAAVALVEESGAGLLTLDAVAARAGVSKGGLLHHFKSKDALLTAMVGRVVDAFEAERLAALQTFTENVGDSREQEIGMVLNYLHRAFAGGGARNQSAMPLFAAAAHQPQLLQPIRDYFARRTQQILDHSNSPIAMLTIMLMADGLWMFDALGVPAVSGRLRKDIQLAAEEWSRLAIETDAAATSSARATAGKPRKSSKATKTRS